MATERLADGKVAVADLNAALDAAGETGLFSMVNDTLNYPMAEPTLQEVCPAVSVPIQEEDDPCTFRDAVAYMRQSGNEDAEHVGAELRSMVELDKSAEKAQEWINMLYSYRGKSRTFPQVTEKNKESKHDIYSKQLEILVPSITQLQSMYRDSLSFVNVVCKEMSTLLIQKKRQETWNEERLWRLLLLLDKIFILDSLKNMKASINNDLAAYKRAQQVLALESSSREAVVAQQMQDMEFYTFLAEKDRTIKTLRDSVLKVKEGSLSYLWVIGEILRLCLAHAKATWTGKGASEESKAPLLPEERHSVFRLMPLCIVLLGTDPKDVKDIMHDKGVGKEVGLGKTISQTMAWICKRPVCHVFGDMQATALNTLHLAPWYNDLIAPNFKDLYQPSDLPEDRATKIGGRYRLDQHLDEMRSTNQELLIALHQLQRSIEAAPARSPGVTTNSADVTPASVYTLCLRVLEAISHWKCLILRQTAWKCARPKNTASSGASEPTSEYEKVLRLNHDAHEWDVLVEAVAMVKGLAGTVRRLEPRVAPFIRAHLHCVSQELVQNGMTPMIKHAAKYKKKAMTDMLVLLRQTVADWQGGREPDNQPEISGKSGGEARVVVPRRTAPSETQMALMRSMINRILAHADKNKGGMFGFSSDELKKEECEKLRRWVEATWHASAATRLGMMVEGASDLSDLYLREFYLEMTKSIQFPISASFPWILASHAIKDDRAGQSMAENALFPLEVYNDAAARALGSLRQRHIYLEIEAEVQICVSQLLDQAARRIYAHYRLRAAAILYPSAVQNGGPKEDARLQQLLRLSSMQVLGRRVEVASELGGRLAEMLRKSQQLAMMRYEARGLCRVRELAALYRMAALTHRLLQTDGVVLPEFRDAWAEAVEALNVCAVGGRLVKQCVAELSANFLPSMVFSELSRTFSQGITDFINMAGREEEESLLRKFEEDEGKSKHYLHLFGSKAVTEAVTKERLQTDVFGPAHAIDLIEVMGLDNMGVLLESLSDLMQDRLSSGVLPFLEKLGPGLPRDTKLQSTKYGVDGLLQYFEAKLHDLMHYPELKRGVFQYLRECGNLLCFVRLLEEGMSVGFARNTVLVRPAIGAEGRFAPSGVANEAGGKMAQLLGIAQPSPATEEGWARGSLRTVGSLGGLRGQVAEGLIGKGGVVATMIGRMEREVEEGAWREMLCGGVDEDGVLGGVIPGREVAEKGVEVYKLWSALNLLRCLPSSGGGQGGEEAVGDFGTLFGDGVVWAGCVLVHLNRQGHRLQLNDFANHVRTTQLALKGHPLQSRDPRTLQFCSQVEASQALHSLILSLLATLYPLPARPQATFIPPPNDLGPSQHAPKSSLEGYTPAQDAPPPPPAPAPAASISPPSRSASSASASPDKPRPPPPPSAPGAAAGSGESLPPTPRTKPPPPKSKPPPPPSKPPPPRQPPPPPGAPGKKPPPPPSAPPK